MPVDPATNGGAVTDDKPTEDPPRLKAWIPVDRIAVQLRPAPAAEQKPEAPKANDRPGGQP